MTTHNKFKYQFLLLAALLLALPFSCERDFEDLEPARFPTDGDVFLDDFSGGLEYSAFGGSNVTAFQVDEDVAYLGAASMRFDIPDLGQPDGSFAGGAFTVPGGRDLSGF